MIQLHIIMVVRMAKKMHWWNKVKFGIVSQHSINIIRVETWHEHSDVSGIIFLPFTTGQHYITNNAGGVGMA